MILKFIILVMDVGFNFSNDEAVPMRLTPNVQKFITPIGIEGPFLGTLLATASSLCEHEVFKATCSIYCFY